MKKYLKMMVVFLLVLVLPLLTIGCGNGQAKNEKSASSNAPAAIRAEVADVTSQNVASASKEEAKSASSKEEAKSTEPEVRDPYEAFVVSEEWATENNATVIERDGKLYSVDGILPEDTVKKYGFGCYNQAPGLADLAYLYVTDIVKSPSDPIVTNRMDLISLGDFPIIKVRQGEVARVYNSYSVPKNVDLVPTEKIGYTIRAFLRSGGAGYLPVLNDTLAGGQMYGDNIGVFDMNDNQVADARDLVYNQNYKYEYYNGTEYHEIIMPANCSAYKYHADGRSADTISLPVELTKNGYAEFSFDVAPGIYYLDTKSISYSVVEVE